MATHRNFLSFFQTLSAELNAQADRVRQLIGSAHWLSDGSHKEALLRGLLERYVPDGTVTSRAFVVDGTTSSSEQDIVVVDTFSERPLFHQSGLVITVPQNVLASISVKTTFGKKELSDAVEGLNTLPVDGDVWCGVYFFNPAPNVADLDGVIEKVQNWLGSARPLRSVWVRVSDDFLARVSPTRVTAHRCPAASTAYFLAQALNAMTNKRSRGPSTFADLLDGAADELETRGLDL